MENENFILDRESGKTLWYNYNGKNKKGETLVVSLSPVVDEEEDNDIMKIWREKGYIPKTQMSWWALSVYAYDEKVRCWGRYNPQTEYHIIIHNGNVINSHPSLNFNWVLEANEGNKVKLLNEVERLFLDAVDNEIETRTIRKRI